jgi:3-deoxy-D-manno-octulosonic acid kinase
MTTGGRRIATATGAMLADPEYLGNPSKSVGESMFEPEFWRARGELVEVSGGRGSAWFIDSPARQWVLRHCRRGGFIARLSEDQYVWAGEDRVRAFAEWRLLEMLARAGLPVPRPIAARYQRSGLTYRCDLITQRIADAEPLAALLARASIAQPRWRAIGAVIARLHGFGVEHADLNAHNILLDVRGAVSVIDFDRGRVREKGAWAAGNLRRLHESLVKISAGMPADRFSPQIWEWLMAGYQAA